MAAKQTVFGPYRVKNIGVGGDIYEIVEMKDNQSNAWYELRPRKTYQNRKPAVNQRIRLDKRWQDEHALEPDVLEYWQQATN